MIINMYTFKQNVIKNTQENKFRYNFHNFHINIRIIIKRKHNYSKKKSRNAQETDANRICGRGGQ